MSDHVERARSKDVRIGWIGLGAIGGNMVLKALEAGLDVTAFARGQRLAQVEAAGATLLSDYPSLAARSDILALCLFDDVQVGRVLFDEGVLAAMRPGAILVNHTTGSPDLAHEIEARIPHGVSVVDAAFSGGPPAVLAGEIIVMAGGSAEAVDSARILLAAYANTIFHVGPLGSGQNFKLLNNLLFAANLKNAAETLKLGQAMGLKASEVASVVQHCSGSSAAMRSFQSEASIAQTLQRIFPYVAKDVATIAVSASACAGIEAFDDLIRFFAAPRAD